MTRKLLILAAIAALFTIVTVVPASALAVETGQGAKTVVPQFNEDGAPSNAHGPACGGLPDPCPNNSAAGPIFPGGLSNPFGDQNVGAWNGVFQSSDNSAICGITATADEIPDDLGGLEGERATLEANTCE